MDKENETVDCAIKDDDVIKLKKLVDEGKVRHVGLSNENPWGFMKFIEYSKIGLPKMITIQNPYSLLNRLFEVGNAEICKRENVGLLAYSPLGFGVLSGKYRNGQMPKNSRQALFKGWERHLNPLAMKAYDKYFKLANKSKIIFDDEFDTNDTIKFPNLAATLKRIKISNTISKSFPQKVSASNIISCDFSLNVLNVILFQGN